MVNLTKVLSALAGATFLAAAPAASAQENFPTKPITFIMGWSAGGMGDTMVRLASQIASRELGQPIVIENRPGSAGQLGMNAVMQAKPDGYTVGYNSPSNYLVGQNMRKQQVDLLENSTQIACFFDYPFGLVVRADAPWKTWQEFKDYAKNNPGKINYATAGPGTMQHITFERVASKEGIKWTHVPYKGGNDTVAALIGGHIHAAIQGPADISGFLKDGRLRMLLAVNDSRWDSVPNVQHIQEVGYDFSAFSRGCVHGPKGMPEPVRAKIEAAYRTATQDAEYRAKAAGLQVPIVFIGGKEYTRMLQDRAAGFREAIEALGLAER